MIRGIHHVAISTPDLDRLVHFYRDLLGCEEVIAFGWEAGSGDMDRLTGLANSSARVHILKAGNLFLELFQFDSPPPTLGDAARPLCDHGLTHICLDVSDIEGEYERLRNAGVGFHCPPYDMGLARVTYSRDPDGNVVELQELAGGWSALALPEWR